MQSPLLQEPLPVRVSVKSCKALRRYQVLLKYHVSGQTWTSVSEQRLFPLEQKAVAL